MNDQDLHNEEQRQILLDLQKLILAQNETIDKQNVILEKQVGLYKAPLEKVEVSGNVEVNTQDTVEVSNLSDIDKTQDVVNAIKGIKPTEEVTVKNIKDAIPKSLSVDNLSEVQDSITELADAVLNKEAIEVVTKEVSMPNTAKDYISVRLTDGKKFYEAMASFVSAANSMPTVISTVTGTRVLAVANADGSAISGGGGSVTTGLWNDTSATWNDTSAVWNQT